MPSAAHGLPLRLPETLPDAPSPDQPFLPTPPILLSAFEKPNPLRVFKKYKSEKPAFVLKLSAIRRKHWGGPQDCADYAGKKSLKSCIGSADTIVRHTALPRRERTAPTRLRMRFRPPQSARLAGNRLLRRASLQPRADLD